MIIKVLGVFKKMVDAFEFAPEDQNQRMFIMRGMLPLLK
jgi:hypothetical protein